MNQGVDLSHLMSGAAGEPEVNAGSTTAELVFDATDQTFESVVALSNTVPVVIDLWAEWCGPCKTLGPILEKVTIGFGGRVALAKVDVDSNPGLARAFNAQSIPTVVALVAGQPVPLFQGALPEQQVQQYYEKLLELAAQHGVTGSIASTEVEEEEAPTFNPLHEEALKALEEGDYERAIAEYQKLVTNHPADDTARVQLARAHLLNRLQGVSAAEVRENAAAKPDDVDAQLLVADLDVSGGHIEDAFLRVLDLFSAADQEDKTRVRERLLEFFEIVGQGDERVAAARTRLANLLF